MNKTIIAIIMIALCTYSYAQTAEELRAEMKPKKDSIAALQAKVNALQAQINALPGWKVNAFGTVGATLSRFNNWFAQGRPNNTAGNIGFTFNTTANLRQEKYFWRNTANINLGWVRLDDRDDDMDSDKFEATTDVFQVTSLFGYNLTPKLAASTLAEYRTTLIDNFNNPGYLDIGLGATWTPVTDLVVVIHPLNYNIVFSDEDNIYESSLGAKIVADYTRKIGAIGFKTNLSTFLSYENSDLNNLTWTNGFSYTLWKSFGIGFDFALRSNKQEALDYSINTLGNIDETFDTVDNELQSFWIFGISYSF
ncbi:MAG: DUF3078 domain-containing protein [Bacteroidota bacterium]